eukprot:5760823-Heterocapsa_arctica.AAC.1
MPRLALAFNIIEKATGLWLKHKKCIIIPLGSQSRQELAAWASKLELGFANFVIASYATYLGISIGM